MKKSVVPLAFAVLFCAIGLMMSWIKGSWFLLFNFGYIGISIGVGLGLYAAWPKLKKEKARRLAQFLVGSYMLVFLGLLNYENMQMEGFFFYCLAGFFSGPVIHYLVAKLLGTVLFGRGWCGWACWTAAVLDMLPYTKSPGRLQKRWEKLRYVHFVISLMLVLILWYGFDDWNNIYYAQVSNLYWLLTGNILYYSTGISMALWFKDNRAFCKYLCPITVFLKIGSHISFMRIKGDKKKCNSCGMCSTICPMDIDVLGYVQSGRRVLSTECVLCQKCVNYCPSENLSVSFGYDFTKEELLRTKK